MIDAGSLEFLISPLLLLVRIILAVAFIVSAKSKLKNTAKFAKDHDIPGPMGVFIPLAELAGGLGVLSGVLAQFAGLGLALIMAGTICMHTLKWHSPYWASKGGWEYDLTLLTLGLIVFVFGPGDFTLAQLLPF